MKLLYSRIDLLTNILLCLLIFSIPIFSDNILKNNLYYLYFFQLLIIYFKLFSDNNTNNKLLVLLSPTLLCISYIGLSCMIGSFAFSHKLVLNRNNLINYQNFKNVKIATFYILSCNYILYLLSKYHIKKIDNSLLLVTKNFIIDNKSKYIIISILLILIFAKLKVDLSYIGGSGNFSFIPISIASLLLIYIISHSNTNYKYFLYFVLLFILSTISYDSKRDVLFLLIPLFLFEILLNNIKISKKFLLKLFSVIIFSFYLIIIMSIKRGYGNFSNNDFFDILITLKNTYKYITSDRFFLYFFNNIEVNYFFFHTYNSIEFICNNLDNLTYGSTILKFLFIPFPKEIFEYKPNSIIDLYTTMVDPYYRKIGGSWPINIYSEYFWNFHLFGIFLLIPIFHLLNKFYCILIVNIINGNIVNNIFLIYMYKEILTFFRGSGIDMFVVYFIVSLFFSYCIKTILLLNIKYKLDT